MSSRHLKRVLESQQPKVEANIESSDDQEEQEEVMQVKSSAFGLLLDSEDDEESEDDDEEEVSTTTNENEPSEAQTSGKKLKEPAKAKLRKELYKGTELSSDEEFEEALKGIKSAASQLEGSADLETEQGSSPFLNLLAAIPELMDPLSELKRKIGNFNPASAGPADQRFAGLIERVQKKKAVTTKGRKGRSQMVAVQPSWPAVPAQAIGLQVRLVEGGEGYMIEHSAAYLQGLRTAVYLMRQGDIDSLVSLIHQSNPYQIDALLVISDYVRMSSANEAAELVEWCVHLMERCFSGTGGKPFSPYLLAGRGSLLIYDIPENRKMHLALFRHVQYLLKRGCYRTALEFCKVMLCLDVEDPLCITPMMAQAALQSSQYAWILEVHKEMGVWKPGQVDWDLAAALALFKLERKDEATALLIQTLSDSPASVPVLCEAAGLPVIGAEGETEEGMHVKALVKILAMRITPILKDRHIPSWLQSCLSQLPISSSGSPSSLWSDQFEHAKIYRHSLLSDITGLNLRMPSGLAAREMNVYDPIPPESINAPVGIVGSLAETLSRILGRFQ